MIIIIVWQSFGAQTRHRTNCTHCINRINRVGIASGDNLFMYEGPNINELFFRLSE